MSEKRRFLEENGFYITTPAGESMLPFIVGGQDLVTVVPFNQPPRKHDAVLYCRENGEHVIHRIVGKRGDCYLLRGDNCYYTERVSVQALLGLAVRVRRKDKEYDLEQDRGYRFAVRLWCAIYPFRWLLNLFKRGGRWLWRKCFGRRNGNETKA